MADLVSNVVRIPRSDEEGSFVLARVSPSGPASRPLNARVVATEGVAPYVLSLRHDRIDKLRGQSAPCSPDEWVQILEFLLLGQGSIENVDATATVKEEATLTITIRKRVQNITQRLGTLSLTYDGDEGIELFEWCGEAVDGRMRAESNLVKATSEQTTLQATVEDLKAQLDEFLKTKAADEAVMLEKFCMLLNEKKLKIRQQQRQLNKEAEEGASAARRAEVEAEIKEEEDLEEDEPVPAPTVASTRGRRGGARGGRLSKVGRGASTTASTKRGAKRRAAAAVSDEEEDSDDDEFEKPLAVAARGSARQKAQKAREVEVEAAADGDSGTQSEEDDRTTENDDGSTEGEEEPEPMQEDVTIKEEDQSQRPKAAAPPQEEAPPPRRTLAFGKAKAQVPAAPAAPASSSKDHKMDGSESETDDEL
ncbi:hypothetical protein SEUCBS139899_000368 [Sporothrix eucalyptigena]|uniref:XRCC4 coiled-coil domain-containing protein n=1 Tax=Sporothrix eucalyptigena TaxID=1812306 RepID=A0ABP0BDB1_9PEZI